MQGAAGAQQRWQQQHTGARGAYALPRGQSCLLTSCRLFARRSMPPMVYAVRVG